jgi:phospholipid/cholesterol/gamma-HCH transport system substrate-binding protein
MTTRSTEIMVGVFVALGFGALFVLAMQISDLSRLSTGENAYKLTAYFQNIGGLKVRSAVTASGVLVGRVTDIVYDPDRYKARVSMAIEPQHDYFSTDTGASIYTSGLLGEQYIALEPGAEDEKLKDGDEIEYTQSALVLEEIISKVLVKLTTSSDSGDKP